jgi:DNA adenine methylase
MDSPLKWHGGKSYLAKQIVDMMPPHLHYVEPYFGGGSVLFEKDSYGKSEVVNDIDGRLSTFWKVMANEELFDQFYRIVSTLPISQELFQYAKYNNSRSIIDIAVSFFVQCRQSLAGRMIDFTPLSRNRLRRGMNEQASAWLTSVDGLAAVHERMISVVVLNDDAIKVIRREDSVNTFFYLDPPYLDETRSSPKVYKHEMCVEDHKELLKVLSTLRGMFMLSGYRSELYDSWAQTFRIGRWDFDVPNNAASGDSKRRMTESIWRNY